MSENDTVTLVEAVLGPFGSADEATAERLVYENTARMYADVESMSSGTIALPEGGFLANVRFDVRGLPWDRARELHLDVANKLAVDLSMVEGETVWKDLSDDDPESVVARRVYCADGRVDCEQVADLVWKDVEL